jgi:hypothetical protein
MYITKSCCEVPAVVSNYSPVGTIENLGDLPVYTVGDKVRGVVTWQKSLQHSKVLSYIEF